jgi:hypothetical protein
MRAGSVWHAGGPAEPDHGKPGGSPPRNRCVRVQLCPGLGRVVALGEGPASTTARHLAHTAAVLVADYPEVCQPGEGMPMARSSERPKQAS